jgi:cell division septation protein DedD
VGRGVRAERGGVSDVVSIAAASDSSPLQTPPPAATPTPAPAGSDPTVAAAPPPAEDLSYFSRLEKSNAAAEKLKPAADRAAQDRHAGAPVAPPPATSAAKSAAPAPAAAKPAPVPAAPAPAKEAAHTAAPDTAPEPTGQGFAVQIAALNVRSEAEAIARRLSSKGYAAYVLSPVGGTPSVYRVRVGKFTTRREAETVAARLQKEEQFKPWVTR